FAGCDRFPWMKTEAAHVAEGAGMLSTIPGAKGTGSIFHHPKMMFVRESQDPVHVGTQTEQVYGDDADCPGGDQPLNLLRVDVKGRQVDVAKNRPGTHVFDNIGC